jgi:hypothetical protein
MMTGFEQYSRKTRRAIFLEEMEQVVPWRELCRRTDRRALEGSVRPPSLLSNTKSRIETPSAAEAASHLCNFCI